MSLVAASAVQQPATTHDVWVSIVGGKKHKGKTLRFVKETEKCIGVQRPQDGATIYLKKEHVDLTRRTNGHAPDEHATTTSQQTSISSIPEGRVPQQQQQFLPFSTVGTFAHNRPTSVSPLPVASSSSSSSSSATATPHCWVSIIGGKHKGKTLRFVKETEKCIGVQRPQDGETIYLRKEHVDLTRRTNGHAPDEHATTTSQQTSISSIPEGRVPQQQQQFLPFSTVGTFAHNRPTSVSPLPVASSSSSSSSAAATPHCWVSIIGGKHKGKTLRFVKETEKCIGVQRPQDGETIYLRKEHVAMPKKSQSCAVAGLDNDSDHNRSGYSQRSMLKNIVVSAEQQHQQQVLPPPSTVSSSSFATAGVANASSSAAAAAISQPVASSSVPQPQQWVSIIAGKHKGKNLRFVKETAKKVAVQRETDGRVIYLEPAHVDFNAGGRDVPAARGFNNNNNEERKNDTRIPEYAGSCECVERPVLASNTVLDRDAPGSNADEDDDEGWWEDFVSAMDEDGVSTDHDGDTYDFVSAAEVLSQQQEEESSTAVPSLIDRRLPFQSGERVFITHGTHARKTALFVKRTAQKIGVVLQGDAADKVRYLDPHHVQRFDPSSSLQAVGFVSGNQSQQDMDPVSRAFCNGVKRKSGGAFIDFCNCTASKRKQTLFGAIFGEDAVFFNVNDTSNLVELPRELAVPQMRTQQQLHLAAVKLHEKAKALTCAYLWAESSASAASRLLALGAFDKLISTKAAARLELLLSTAATPNHIHSSLNPSDFCMIPEHGNVGCGYIPRFMIDRLLGNNKAQEFFALQVRIAIPSMGIFKGVLTEKQGIDKIELPSSLQKAHASVSPAANRDAAWLMINQSGTYPFVSRIQRQQNHFIEEREIPDMARSMLMQKGVSESYLLKHNRYHDTCKGLVDPTDGLPSECVFLTGIQDDLDLFGDKIVISRYPMTEASDGCTVRLVKTKPDTMSAASWDFLCKKEFGTVFFGKPAPGQRALPERIAQGDCDGDDYFLCWDPYIVRNAIVGDRPKIANKNSSARPPAAISPGDWLRCTQECMMDIESKRESHRLISSLHNMWRRGLQNNQQEALVFGRAFKEAIDVTKHGGKVNLPAHLVKHIPHNLHQYLNSV